MTRSPLSAARTPFIRLLVPLLAGIAVESLSGLPGWCYALPALAGMALWIATTGHGRIEEQYRRRRYFGWGLFLIIFSLGAILHTLQHRPHRFPEGFYPVAVAHIDQRAAEKSNTYYCPATLMTLVDTTGAPTTYHEKVALYFEKSLQARRLGYGDQVAFKFNLHPIKTGGNPGDFDFATFMQNKGIARSQYLADSEWRCIGHRPHSKFWELSTTLQSRLAHQIDTCRLSPHSAQLLKALLLGDRQEFPQEMRQTFSAAGLSHILAVSGLHMGVVASLVYLLLFPLAWSEWGRRLRPLLTLIALWLYACVTGLSPSAVRACIMASFLLTAELLERRNSSLNALFAAAFFMLVYDSRLLFDVGFQMSFAAVAAILLFYRRLDFGGRSPHAIIRWVSSCIAVSLAAQLGALPIAVYYFHTIPLLFLIGNLVVLPLLPFIFGLALFMLLLTALHLPYEWIAAATDWLLQSIEWLSYHIEQLPGSHIEGVWLAPRYLWLYLAGGVLAYLTVKRRSKRLLWATLGAGIVFLTADLATYHPPRPEMVVYESEPSTVVQLSGPTGCYLLLPDSLPQSEELAGEAYRRQNGHKAHKVFGSRSGVFQSEEIFIAYPFAWFYNKRLLLLDDCEWQRLSTSKRLTIDYAIIDRRFNGRLDDVTRLFDVRHFVIAANVHPARARLWLNDCYEREIPCHDVRTQGAWIYAPE